MYRFGVQVFPGIFPCRYFSVKKLNRNPDLTGGLVHNSVDQLFQQIALRCRHVVYPF
jgi:hypothetical protein